MTSAPACLASTSRNLRCPLTQPSRSPRTPPGDAVDDDLVNDQMPVNVGITDDGAAAAQSEASGAVTEPSFLKQLGIRLGYALRPGPSFRR